MIKRRVWLLAVLGLLLGSAPAVADNRIIVHASLGLQGLQQFCLLQNCTVVSTAIDGSLGQVFLLTTPLDPAVFLTTVRALPGIVDAEVDQILSLVGGNLVPSPLPTGLLLDRTSVSFHGTTVWNAYVSQPASGIIQVQNAQNMFSVLGTGIIADIDTGVDPNHPALQTSLVAGGGYDFTRSQAGASEMNDLSASDFTTFPPPTCDSTTCPSAAVVNQSSAAILDQSSAAILDTNVRYAAFGHGTMVMGVIHLVAPQAQLLPLKAFKSDGTGYLSDILRAIYYAVQNNAKVINMSFDFKANSPDPELKAALDYAANLGLICVASAGNDGAQVTVYPAGLQTDVMGVASVSTTAPSMRSSFSNYGNAIVWVAAPGEAIITTYPFSTYSAGWGTSFSAPFVSGGVSLLLNRQASMTQLAASTAIAKADALDASLQLGNGRLNLVSALNSVSPGTTSDFTVSAAPSTASVTAGGSVNFTASAAPVGGFKGTVTLSCSGAPAAATCTVSPSQVTLNGADPATATVTLTTMARSFAPPLTERRFVPPTHFWILAPACLAYLVICSLLWRFTLGPRRRVLLAATCVLPIALFCASCGGSGTTNSGSTHGTPAGAFSIMVSATSSSTSHSATVTLNVN